MASPPRRSPRTQASLLLLGVVVFLLGSFLPCVPSLSGASPAPALAAECIGDECQGPPPPPEEVTPSTAVVEGPPNPPVRFPESHHGGHRHHAGKGKGRYRRHRGRHGGGAG